MTKPKNQLQKRDTYARDSRKVKKTLLCVEQCTAFLIKSLFKFVTLRPGVFLAENTSCETDFSVGFTPSYLVVFCCAAGSPKRSLASAFTKSLAISLQN